MKAAVNYENGPPSVLRCEEVPDPRPGDGEILFKVEAISIEGGDLLNRRMFAPPKRPHVIGYQAAGTVLATGPGAKRFKAGQRVASLYWAGAYAELRAVPEDMAWPVPDGLDIKIAAAVPATFGTADDALFSWGGLKSGETVLVHGSAGGVGLATIQLAHAAGAKVICTSSSDERLERLTAFGMDHGINHRKVDFAEEARRLTGGKGVDLAVDMVGGPDFQKVMKATAFRGRIAIVGFANGAPATIDQSALIINGLILLGVYLGPEMASERVRAMIDKHMRACAAGTEKMPIDKIFPLSEAAAAHRHIETGHPFGRVIMVP
ncbi:MAG TPA: zinc-binding dehydrogenase [Alphaproteobacteria bacterium]|nr:zinc-binding dehydrogenase [Alphaproteobacteria bacterium]